MCVAVNMLTWLVYEIVVILIGKFTLWTRTIQKCQSKVRLRYICVKFLTKRRLWVIFIFCWISHTKKNQDIKFYPTCLVCNALDYYIAWCGFDFRSCVKSYLFSLKITKLQKQGVCCYQTKAGCLLLSDKSRVFVVIG